MKKFLDLHSSGMLHIAVDGNDRLFWNVGN